MAFALHHRLIQTIGFHRIGQIVAGVIAFLMALLWASPID
jgi:hypothetical protein